MQKTKIIEEEINRVIEEIESSENFLKMEEKLKQNLKNFIEYLNDFMGLNPFNFTLSGLKYCYEDQLKFVEKRIREREKQKEKLSLQLDALKEILNMVKKSEKNGGNNDK